MNKDWMTDAEYSDFIEGPIQPDPYNQPPDADEETLQALIDMRESMMRRYERRGVVDQERLDNINALIVSYGGEAISYASPYYDDGDEIF